MLVVEKILLRCLNCGALFRVESITRLFLDKFSCPICKEIGMLKEVKNDN